MNPSELQSLIEQRLIDLVDDLQSQLAKALAQRDDWKALAQEAGRKLSCCTYLCPHCGWRAAAPSWES